MESVHYGFLVDSESLIVEQQDASECIQNLTFFVVVVYQHLLVILEDVVGDELFLVQFDAGLQCAVDDLSDQCCVADQHFVVETDVVEETGGTDTSFEVGKDIWNVLHQFLL